MIRTNTTTDPRLFDETWLEDGSYIEDGEHLYYVVGRQRTPARGMVPARETLCVENCKTEYLVQLDLRGVRRSCRPVRRGRAGVGELP